MGSEARAKAQEYIESSSTPVAVEGFFIRRATPADLDTLIAHRCGMFRDMGYKDESVLARMAKDFRVWLKERMEANRYLAWLVIAPNGDIAAGAGLWIMDWPPHMIGSQARRGNILNVYTDASYRRKGLARWLMDAMIAWCQADGLDTVILHASKDGRHLYESMGFAATNEMRIQLEPRS